MKAQPKSPESTYSTAGFKALYIEMRRDVDELLEAGGPDDVPTPIPDPARLPPGQRRGSVRAFAAFVEGVCFSLKQLALSLAPLGRLSAAEVLFCHEVDYELDASGVPVDRPARMRTLSNLRFAFHVLNRAVGGSFKLDVASAGWRNLCTAMKVRDRLMHPKGIASMRVSDEEIRAAVRGYRWFDAQALALALDIIELQLEKTSQLKGLITDQSASGSTSDVEK